MNTPGSEKGGSRKVKMEVDKRRNRDYIDQILNSDDSQKSGAANKAVLGELVNIYKTSIKPLEEAYKFSQLTSKRNPVAEIYAKPSLLFLGPWSTGKTSMINYILGIEGSHSLRVGVEPTSSDFVVIDHGPKRKTLAGTALLADESKPYRPLEQYGIGLSARLHGEEFPVDSLRHLTVIDTPGIMENYDQTKQGYSHSEVCQWFIQRASLIFLVFDPSKLDAGKHLREVVRKLKGHEDKLRIILNKSDSVDALTLVRTYGAFCWNLKTLMPNLPEPPRVYMVSCWGQPYKDTPYKEVLEAEELSLIQDIRETMDNRCEKLITSLLTHALSVETHAITVDAYLNAFDDHRHRWLRWKNGELQTDVVDCPDLFDVPQRVGAKTSNHDGYLNVLVYRRFFLANPLSSFYRASQGRDGVVFAGATVLEKAQKAIKNTIPNLLSKHQDQSSRLCRDVLKSSKGIISSTFKVILSPREQLKELMVKQPLSGLLMYSPVGFVTQKVQGALKGY